MKIVPASFEIMFMPDPDAVMINIEAAGRTCYKSEDKITPDSARAFVKRIIASGHESVIEHATATVRFVCDRGVTHELVRHRVASYSQESTRYANYSKDKFGSEITVIRPLFWDEDSEEYALWKESMEQAERLYLALIEKGAKAQEARSVLPNSLKTEIVMTANLREWRHVFRLRCDSPAHPQIREIMLPLLDRFGTELPALFGDLREKYAKDIESFQQRADELRA
ncbi:FAD-dependent thymidylate synthase [Desulfobaculum bizertense]|uniref:FAD-dependent thymidylate synthase n=1 Tax=Desulfobaculum bizertense DSM 18034 TaxID=1121442 RepID=A0A1T4VJL1_9BACT|nr:FAD-dependent thymidylate synthase [Desulfobaculum bizertense]SKA65117.1 thymidylate synthase (FAD) [Desulfobaculum bizertense DSM 18034]